MATSVSRIALHDAPRTLPARAAAALPSPAIWHESAPEAVREAVDWMAGSDGWVAWSAHLSKRSDPRPLSSLLPGKAVLLWGIAATDDNHDGGASCRDGYACGTAELILSTDRLSRKKQHDGSGTLAVELATWLGETSQRRGTGRALESLAWGRALPRLAAIVPAGLWWRLLADLFRAVDAAQELVETDPLVSQLLGVELPLSLAHQFPEIHACRDLAGEAVAQWERGIGTLVDADGFVNQRHLSLVRPLLACWTRVKSIVEPFDQRRASPLVSTRYRRFVREALRLTRRDGSMALTADRPSAGDAALFLAAVAHDDDHANRNGTKSGGADRRFVESMFFDRPLPSKQLDYGRAVRQPSAHSETAGLAVLRPSWSPASPRLWVAYGGTQVRIELACGRDRLFSGVWDFEIRLGGRSAAPRGSWEEVCWVSDQDADYLELELALSDHVRLQRQMLLAREDGLLFLADVVLGGEAENIEYRGTLPLADDVAFDAAGETREGYLVGRKPRAIVFPLALPEWRSESCGGSLEATAAGLELRQSRASAQRLYAPLLFDLDGKRMFRPATWRTLTVAENRAVVPADAAVGYRAQIGKEQWLFYRSLAERGNRTVLGQNLVSEFLAARFTRGGETDPLLEIE